MSWQEFFDELEGLLHEFCIRHSQSNHAYCKYTILSRCGVSLRSISGIKHNAEQLLRDSGILSEEVQDLQDILSYSNVLLSSL